jgi:LPS sulfotransferase NodH
MNQKKGWKTYFWEKRIEPLLVMYEDLVSGTREIIVETLNYLEIEVPKDFVVPESPLKRQANLVNDDWLMRYKNSVFYR